MKKSTILLALLGIIAAFSGNLFAESDIFSVNLWATGKAWGGGAYEDPATHDLLKLAPEQAAGAGDWNTTGWENLGWGTSPFSTSLAPTTITSSGGSTATLEVLDQRNSSPYNWNSLRDDSDAVDIGNATLLDAHSSSTEDPYDGSNTFVMEVRDITLGAYDVIVYLGINSGQKFDGKGTIVFNGVEQQFTMFTSEPDGALVEIIDETTPGNYIIFENVSGSSFTVQTWGKGFTHLGPAGIQFGVIDTAAATVNAGSDWITWSGEPVILDDVSVINNDPGAGDLTLTWSAEPLAGVTVGFSDIHAQEPTVAITKTAPTQTATAVMLTLTVTQPGKEPIESSMTIDVYDDACRAALGAGKATIKPGDFNANCVTDLEDLSSMVSEWLVDFSLTAPVDK